MRRRRVKDLRGALLLPATLALCVPLVPVTIVAAIAFGESAAYEFPPRGLSLRWFAAFFDGSTFSSALFFVSLPVALLTALLSTVLGGLAAVGLVRGRFPGRRQLELFFLTPVIFPHIILGVGLFLLYTRLAITPNILSLCIGHTVIGTPYVIRTVAAALAGIDRRLEEAARNLGASETRAFLLVTLPLLRSSLLSGAIFAFIVSFSDINLSLFLSSADTATLPVQILAQMQYSSDPTIAAASTLQVLIVGALVLVAQAFVRNVRS